MVGINYIIAMLLVSLGLYCLLFKRNLIKLVIGLAVMTDGIHLFLISLGYRLEGIAAHVPEGMILTEFAARAVDPIPQALVLTSIVINICILALALSIAIYTYRYYGTLDPFRIRRLRE